MRRPTAFRLSARRPAMLPVVLLCAILALPLTACGVADTGTSAATVAKAKAAEAEQARSATAQVQQQLDAANQQAEQRRKEIEAATK